MFNRTQPLFWLGNVVFASLAVACVNNHIVAIVGLTLVSLLLIGWAVTGAVDRPRLHAIIGDNWIEGEIGIYSSLAFWGGVLIAGVAPQSGEQMPLFGVIAALVTAGLVGMLVSLMPLSRLLNR